MSVILASTSRIRGELLTKAGVVFEVRTPEVDESVLKAAAEGLEPGALAQSLAAAKAVSVSNRFPGRLVIGADQILNLQGRTFDKPRSREEARGHLLELRGRAHILETAVCCARGESIVWRHLSRATLAMRAFSEAFLDSYLDRMGAEVTTSVGGYKLEGLGAQLFQAVDGDYFTILGLPLLPLLDFLRRQDALAA
ncbi:MAG: nucleoside triphosphate pyrophosphatase [Parvibaculaceae bacterium]